LRNGGCRHSYNPLSSSIWSNIENNMISRAKVIPSRANISTTRHGLWTMVACLWLVYIIVFGGVSLPNTINLTLQSCTSLAVIVVCLLRLRQGMPTKLSVYGSCLLLLCFIIVFAQLIPLPPAVWSSFPGREFQVRIFEVLGTPTPWQPISLTPGETKSVALALLPAAAGFLLAISSRAEERVWFALTIVCCAFLGLFAGLMQQTQGPDSSFYFYGHIAGVVSGTFGNRNFFAGQLYATIPFVAALSVAAQEKFRLPNWLIAIFALVYISLLVIGLAGTASRAGILLAMVAVLLAAAFIYRPQSGARTGGAMGFISLSVLGAVILLSQVGMAAILRLAKTDLADIRGPIFDISVLATKAFFPIGTGFGSFVPVYKMFETPGIVFESYINHAHNDWLELLLEGGAAAAVLIMFGVMLYSVAVFQLLRQEFQSSGRAILRAGAVVVLLLALHGLVDFGLRTPAMLTIFSLSCGLLTLGYQKVAMAHSNNRRTHRDAAGTSQPGKRRTQPGTGGTFTGSNSLRSDSRSSSSDADKSRG
jgi:O-antigen ligase